mgnify:CR=1 FL=1
MCQNTHRFVNCCASEDRLSQTGSTAGQAANDDAGTAIRGNLLQNHLADSKEAIRHHVFLAQHHALAFAAGA